jgi:hypothetical protein
MSTYKTTPSEEAMMRGATMRRSEGAGHDGKGRSVVIQPLLYVYPDGVVWMYGDDDLSKPHRSYGDPARAARALQELIERAVAQAIAYQAADTSAE